MKVNFDNLRVQTCYAYDRLASKLNGAIKADGTLNIYAEEINDDMDELRQFIATIAMCQSEIGDAFGDVLPKDKEMVEFNPDNL